MRPYRRPAARCIAVVAATLLLLSPIPRCPAAEGLLLLSNGNLLAGQVVRTGDFYEVTRPGSELMVPAAQVDAFCRSSLEAYEIRRRRAFDDAAGHVELARWCVHNELWEQAAAEILVARSVDPRTPGLRFVERQLAAQLRREDAQRNAAARSARELPDSPVAHAADAENESAKPAQQEQLGSSISPSAEAQAQFARSIQPMLIHSCATTGCHQAGSDAPMSLDRMAIVGGGNAAAVERNLRELLPLLDAEHPDDSPLIKWARRNHQQPDARRSTALSPHQAKLLIQWVRETTGYQPPLAAGELADDKFVAARPGVMPTTATHHPPRQEFIPADEMLLSDAELQAYGMTGAAAAAEGQPSRGAMIAVGEPAAGEAALSASPLSNDPFDPAEFNRRRAERYHAMQQDKDAPAEAAQSESAEQRKSARPASPPR